MPEAIQEFEGNEIKETISTFHGNSGLLMDGRSVIKIKDVSIMEYRIWKNNCNGAVPIQEKVEVSFDHINRDAALNRNRNHDAGKPRCYSLMAVGKMSYGSSAEAKIENIILSSPFHGESAQVSYSRFQ